MSCTATFEVIKQLSATAALNSQSRECYLTCTWHWLFGTFIVPRPWMEVDAPSMWQILRAMDKDMVTMWDDETLLACMTCFPFNVTKLYTPSIAEQA
jgi:hypothetical protein